MYISGADNNPGLKSIINTGVSHVFDLSRGIFFLMNSFRKLANFFGECFHLRILFN